MQATAEEAADPAADFSQVQFIDVPRSYPTGAAIICSYSPSPSFKPSPKDWVGLFKVGWSSTKEYSTFVWAEPRQDASAQSESRQVVFKEYYLPKDDGEFYQFCFVDSSVKVRGLSSPFCFTNTEDQSFNIIPEEDMMVVTSKDELEHLKEENQALKNIQQKLQEELTNTKEESEERVRDVLKQLEDLKEEKEVLDTNLKEQLQENQRLQEQKEEAEKKHQKEEQEEEVSIQRMNTEQMEEKYTRSLMKINQLKEERSKLKEELLTQREEISRLKAQTRDEERELSRARDTVQLMEVELQSCKKEKNKLSVELQRLQNSCHRVEEVQQENQELCRRLSLMEDKTTTPPGPHMKSQCEALSRRLSEAEHKLCVKNEEMVNLRRRAELQEQEIQDGRRKLERTLEERNQEEAKRLKMEMQFKELQILIADQGVELEAKEKQILLEKQEKEELLRENQTLSGHLEDLGRVCSALGTQSMSLQEGVATPAREYVSMTERLSRSNESEHLYQSIETNMDAPEDKTLVCRYCHESFPGITDDELEQHEQTHRVCPFCNLVCDLMEQGAFEDHVYGH